METYSVINIKNTLKARQLLACFDLNLQRLIKQGVDKDESEVDVLEMLSSCLEEALENGMDFNQLKSRASQLARYAVDQGYAQHEIENLLTMRPNPNGKRPS